MKDKKMQSIAALQKELQATEKQEGILQKAAYKSTDSKWKQRIAEKVPEAVSANLTAAFCKAFSLIFEKGTDIIEKSYKREEIQEEHEVRAFEFQVKANRKSLKKIRGGAGTANLMNMALTTAEGIGLGALGIGLPDIVVFVGVLLKGVYQTALHYGFDYDSPQERYFILKLMETAMQKGTDWDIGNAEVDRLMTGFSAETDWQEAVQTQITQTANVFAMDMVVLKFIQGLPIVGMVGGAGNPIYYNKVVKYVDIKYRKRYLQDLLKK